MTKNNFFSIAIILSSIVVAFGIVFLNKSDDLIPQKNVEEIEETSIRPISENDHILGNPSAPIIIVEYSDFECPFCKQFHLTMNRIMDEFGKTGKVAWVYRHFPLTDIHKDAYTAAVASECVSNLGSESDFWNFSDKVFEGAPNSLAITELQKIAADLGIDTDDFNSCVSQNPNKNKIDQDIADGMSLYDLDPNFGTPYNILITRNGIFSVAGSQPYNLLKEIINQNL